MTKEEALEILKKYKEESEEDYYVKRAKALNMAIKALELEQEPVLNKIKAEIRNEQNMDYKCHRKTYDNCLRIIDKYKSNIRDEVEE